MNKLQKYIAKLFVPKGAYCYKIKDVIPDVTYGFIIKTKPCKYYSHNKNNNRSTCKLLNITDDLLLDDQCKLCGINEND